MAKSTSLIFRLDEASKAILNHAATLRGISVSDYIRTITLAQARKEIAAAQEQTISLSAEEQLAFWEALNATPVLTPNQKKLGALMRGES